MLLFVLKNICNNYVLNLRHLKYYVEVLCHMIEMCNKNVDIKFSVHDTLLE